MKLKLNLRPIGFKSATRESAIEYMVQSLCLEKDVDGRYFKHNRDTNSWDTVFFNVQKVNRKVVRGKGSRELKMLDNKPYFVLPSTVVHGGYWMAQAYIVPGAVYDNRVHYDVEFVQHRNHFSIISK